MKPNFTDTSRTLRNCSGLRPALRTLLDLHAFRTRQKKTLLIMSMASTRTWYAHLSGEWVITPGAFAKYKERLAVTSEERTVLDDLYAQYRSALTLEHYARRSAACGVGAALANSELLSMPHDLEEFLAYIRTSLEPRRVPTVHKDLYQLLRRQVDSGEIFSKSKMERSAKQLALVFSMHMKAYASEDAELQKSALHALSSIDVQNSVPLVRYVRHAMPLYGLNTQDRSWSSSHALGAPMQRLLLDEFIKLRDLTRLGSKRDGPFSKIITLTESAAEFNVLSLEIEIAGPAAKAQIKRLERMWLQDRDDGIPLYSGIYDLFPRIEYLISCRRLDDALNTCNFALELIAQSNTNNTISEAQLRIKRGKVLHYLVESAPQPQKPYLAQSLLSELDAAITVAKSNSNSRMEGELWALRHTFRMRYDLDT